jgi:hypothetical protein
MMGVSTTICKVAVTYVASLSQACSCDRHIYPTQIRLSKLAFILLFDGSFTSSFDHLTYGYHVLLE